MPRYYAPEPTYGGGGYGGSRGGMSILDIIMAKGQQEAEGARRGGDIWANAIGQMQQQIMGGLSQYRDVSGQEQVQRAIGSATSQYPEATHPKGGAQPDSGMNHLDSILNSIDPELRPQAMKGIQEIQSSAQKVQEHNLQIKKLQSDLQDAEQKRKTYASDYGANMGHQLQQWLDKPDGGLGAAMFGFGTARELGTQGIEEFGPGLEELARGWEEAKASGDPAKIAAAAEKNRQNLAPIAERLVMGGSPEFQDRIKPKTREVSVLNKDGSKTVKIVNDVAGQDFTSAPEPETRSIDVQLAEAKLAGDTKRYGELLKVKSDEARAGRDPANAPGPDLSADGLDMAALNYRKTGIMPALGNGDKVTRKRIIDRAATLSADDIKIIETGGRDVASNKAVFRADSTALNKLQQQTDAVAAFEKTASRNGDLLEKAIKDIPDLGTKFFNAPIRAAADSLGSEKMATFTALRQSVVDEYARIIANPNLTGQMSDSARHEGDVLLNPNSTVKQFMAALKALRAEASNRHTSYSEQLKEIKGRMGGQGGTTGGGEVSVTAPNGKTYKFPSAAEADAFKLKAGIQ